MNENLQFTDNQKEVLSVFLYKDLDEDHFREGHTFNRFSVFVKDIYGDPIFIPDNVERTDKNIRILMTMLKGLIIQPDELLISNNNILLSFHNRGVYIENIYDYFTYSMEFVDYIEQIDFCTMTINSGSFIDSSNDVERSELIKAQHFIADFENLEPYELEIYDLRKGKHTVDSYR